MLLLAAACSLGPPCPDGTARQDDGLCYAEAEPDGPTADEVIAALPACTLGEGNGRLDLDGHCLDGACAGDSYADVNRAIGEVGYCYGVTWAAPDARRFSLCEWSVGIATHFPAVEDPDAMLGFVPDPEAATGWPLVAIAEYTGTAADGLAPASGLACWIDALGEPSLTFAWEDEELVATWAWWPDADVRLASYTRGGQYLFLGAP